MEVHFSEYEQSNTFVMHQVQIKVIKENDIINAQYDTAAGILT